MNQFIILLTQIFFLLNEKPCPKKSSLWISCHRLELVHSSNTDELRLHKHTLFYVCYVWRRYRSQQPSSGPQENSFCLRHTLMLRMKCAALVASLFLRVLSCPGATGESGSCQGKTVDVFLDSSFISGGDYFPDTYVKVGYTVNTSCLRAPFIINTSQLTFSIFTDECWRSVQNKQSCQK